METNHPALARLVPLLIHLSEYEDLRTEAVGVLRVLSRTNTIAFYFADAQRIEKYIRYLTTLPINGDILSLVSNTFCDFHKH